jgi:hypothetical protein
MRLGADVFGGRKRDPEPDPEALPPGEPEPDYPAMVERELRVADGQSDAERMWAPILASLQALQRKMTFVYVGRRTR